jgi:hypothetical protein
VSAENGLARAQPVRTKLMLLLFNERPDEEEISFNSDEKFDFQLSQALIHERRLGEIFTTGTIERIELKTETWLWERTGNICVEYRSGDRPSGIATTRATCWVHELKRDDQTLCYLMFPIERLKQLVRTAIKAGRWRAGAGDDGRFHVALVPLREILR